MQQYVDGVNHEFQQSIDSEEKNMMLKFAEEKLFEEKMKNFLDILISKNEFKIGKTSNVKQTLNGWLKPNRFLL